MIAKIAVSAAPFAIDKPYSYAIPGELQVEPGLRVMVPFGPGNRLTEGVVLSVEPGEEASLKSICQVLDKTPLLSPVMLRLAAFLRERCYCTFFEAIRAMLPAGLWFRQVERFALAPGQPWEGVRFRQPDAKAILEYLQAHQGEALDRQLQEAVCDAERRRKALKYLLQKKWITGNADFLRRTGDRSEWIAELAASAEEVHGFCQRHPRSFQKQRSVLEAMTAMGRVSVKELCYFTGATTATVRRLEEMGFLRLSEKPVLRCREIVPAKLEEDWRLNQEQSLAFEGLCRQMDGESPGAALLYGVTGSGKTAVYLKLIARCMEQGKSAMLLVPEIALTAQLLSLLAAHFGHRVALLHSSLAVGERYDQWKRLHSGEAKVAVGTRSAVFAPCQNLGLIVMDEEQEHSYKSEQTPRYSAKEVALWRGAREKALVVLGSATPSVETMYRAKTGELSLHRLSGRFNGRPLPKVQLVDLREEWKAGRDSPFSLPLLEGMRDNYATGKQTILFLNRRGAYRALVCVDCRESPECPRCSNRLTYHSANRRLMCHYCGHSQPVRSRCGKCGGPLKPLGLGTQQVQRELEIEFPDMPIFRMDADTVTALRPHEAILADFKASKGGALIGTQMVAKGLNLPDVTLVGVLDADLSLYSDSYRAAESTFNMLTQVVGRAGRGQSEGRAVIQTVAPHNGVLRLGAMQDYDGFYDLEIGLRRVTGSPPFADLITVTFTGEDEAQVVTGAGLYRDSLLAWLRESDGLEQSALLGPAPCPVMKINNQFRYRLTLRCPPDRTLHRVLGYLLRRFLSDRKNRGVWAYVDINGYDA